MQLKVAAGVIEGVVPQWCLTLGTPIPIDTGGFLAAFGLTFGPTNGRMFFPHQPAAARICDG